MTARGSFLGVEYPGRRIEGSDGWVVKGKRVLPGYQAKRRVKLSDTDSCVVLLKVKAAEGSGEPVYSCSCCCDDESPHGTVSGNTSTSVCNQFLSAAKGHPASGSGKRWPGPSFFGLDIVNVTEQVETAFALPVVEATADHSVAISEDASRLRGQSSAGTRKETDLTCWAGVTNYGQVVEGRHWQLPCGEQHIIYLRDGYMAKRIITTAEGAQVDVSCTVLSGDDGRPAFNCSWRSGEAEITEVTTSSLQETVEQMMMKIKPKSTRKWHHAAINFFGLHLLKVSLAEPPSSVTAPTAAPGPAPIASGSLSPPVESLAQNMQRIVRRNAGPSSMLAGQHRQRRMDLCEQAIDLITFGDIRDLVQHLIGKYPEVVDEAIDSSPAYTLHLREKLLQQTQPVIYSAAQCGELLTGAHSLTERAYKNTRRILQEKNVHLASYAEVAKHLSSLDVGVCLTTADCPGTGGEPCSQCFVWDLADSLQRIVSTPELFEALSFPTESQQKNLFSRLRQARPDIYASLDETWRTLFLRQTGDNYRAALKRQATQQMSFSILNLKKLVYSPHGQFVVASWRGGESRAQLKAHMSKCFEQLYIYAKNGVCLNIGKGQPERFNVVVLYVSDFSHTKEVLGRVQVTAEQGCPVCDRPCGTWHKPQAIQVGVKTVSNLGLKRDFAHMCTVGQEAECSIGANPDKTSAQYKNWYKDHGGQTGVPLVECLCPETVPPCALHLQLALHRSLWKKISVVVKSRQQEDLLPLALRSIGCTYLAFQIELYFKNKKKSYDGSDTLKMTGVDCIRLEEQIEKFALFFVRPGQELRDTSCLELRQLIELFTITRSITAEMRALETTEERVTTFKQNVEKLFDLMSKVCPAECLTGIPYLHALRDHVSLLMELWYEALEWGYGYFSCMASEHLNKHLKEIEYEETNFGSTSLLQAVTKTRIRTFYYPSSLFNVAAVVTCSACHQMGHNRRNKLCPAKRPELIDIGDSDDENPTMRT